jgi:hypothetical protein
MVIATCVLLGQLCLVPLVLLPRRLTPIRVEGRGVAVLMKPIEHWAETVLSVLLATGVGLALRLLGSGIL